jgi:hypothetical protein
MNGKIDSILLIHYLEIIKNMHPEGAALCQNFNVAHLTLSLRFREITNNNIDNISSQFSSLSNDINSIRH